ncbi:hypothetical protein C3747_65g75 [Trypanosoma cruzi]|uniref:Uncharacterized protein n=2 Tax=Trypanosoma cruzi TaxID=5693 RepID=Q4DZX0_TRYCC|nr:hypothetical protein, conserved [Trypanosoma cruzi]EAN98068.1 hypothetical protein, conserved [Trypanosoma cruzi]PWV10834.1 hypothetical protein C3747_65g75 [Trypanosoma cruzi]RNC48072.1 hypothetical protein TcCL_NonESM02002 [Trypanosoma cruzi]|eukprot:XP_819919.1 hypothetical protein [Trypanosoma cruzi strain CL Brener]
MSTYSARPTTQTFSINGSNKKGGLVDGNTGDVTLSLEEKGNVVEINPVTKSLYLTVATSRAFPYVTNWLREKSSEMRNEANSLEWNCDMELSRQLDQKHKAILTGRVASEKERQKMLHFLQELYSVRLHQRAAGESWFVAFRDAAAAYMSELHEMEKALLQRVSLAEEWTIGGKREVVVAGLKRMEKQQQQLKRRAEREVAREKMRRDQTLHSLRAAMEQLVGEVGDALTWELHRCMHGHVHTSFEGRKTAMNDSVTGALSDTAAAALPAPPEDERELLEQERQLRLELRRFQKRGRKMRRETRAEEDGEGKNEGRLDRELSGRKQTWPFRQQQQHEVEEKETKRKNKKEEEEEEEEASGATSEAAEEGSIINAMHPVAMSLLSSPHNTTATTTNATKMATSAENAAMQSSSVETGRLPPSRRRLQLHSGRTWTEVSQSLTLPPLPTVHKGAEQDIGGNIGEGGKDGPTSTSNPPAGDAGSRMRQLKYHRAPLVVRPPVVQPPNRAGRDAGGRHKSGHIAGLLSVLTEDTAHFAASREKIRTELKRLRGELRKHKEETERMMQTSTGLERQRTQLLVQCDAQEAKLNAATAEKRSQEKVRTLDTLLLNDEISHTMELLEEQKKKRSAETEEVRKSIEEFKQRIQEHEQLLHNVREYWCRSAAALRRTKNPGNCQKMSYSWDSTLPSASGVEGAAFSLETAFCSTAPPSRPFLEGSPLIPTVQPHLVSSVGSETKLPEEMSEGYQSIPALGLYQPEEVADFICSVFEELTVGSPGECVRSWSNT